MADGQHAEAPGGTASPAPIRLPAAVEAFVLARRPRKDSPHTGRAYANDLRGIGELLARCADTEPVELTLADLTVPRLRSAFAEYADGHAKASINAAGRRGTSCSPSSSAEGLREGNPMPAVAKAKLARRLPKPLNGEDTPERLLEAAAAGRRRARDPWPQRDLAVLATLLLTGLRWAELLELRGDSLVGRPGERRLHVVGKGGKARSVPIEPPQAVLAATGLPAGTVFPTTGCPGAPPCSSTPAASRCDAAAAVPGRHRAALAGLNDRRARGAPVHALRHTFATRFRGRCHRHRDHEPARPRLPRDYFGETAEGHQRPMLNVFHRDGETIRHFWGSELLYAPTDPGQDPRHLGTIEPLWNLCDLTPAGRGTDWDEQLSYA